MEFSAVSEPIWLVLAGLLISKPISALLFGWCAAHILKLGLLNGMPKIDLFVVGCFTAIGFRVAFFVTSESFPSGPVQDDARMGALLSFGAAKIPVIARLLEWSNRTDSTRLVPILAKPDRAENSMYLAISFPHMSQSDAAVANCPVHK